MEQVKVMAEKLLELMFDLQPELKAVVMVVNQVVK